MSPKERRKMVNKNASISLKRQCKILKLSRSALYYKPVGFSPETLDLMRQIDRVFTQYPFFGSRQIAAYLPRKGYHAGRHRVRRLMKVMGLEAIYKRPNTSKKHPENRIYPYLLRGMQITGANQVWCADISYIPVKRGFLYLVAIMDWATRKVLSWRLSNTMDARFCVEALQDGRGRYLDNIFIERLWRSLKQEAVYLHELTDRFMAEQVIRQWIKFYNTDRPHTALDKRTPD